MAEYIERAALYQELHNAGGCDAPKNSWADGWDQGINEAIRLLNNAPTADVVEVVRCKDCEHSYFVKSCSKYECKKGCGTLKYSNDFCNYGVAKMDGKDGAGKV